MQLAKQHAVKSTIDPRGDSTGAVVLCYSITALLLSICFTQLRWQAYFAQPLFNSSVARTIAEFVLVLMIPALAWWTLRGLTNDRLRVQCAVLVMALFCAGYSEVLHIYLVDVHNNDPALHSNFEWQWKVQNEVLALMPSSAPHSYRFLPNCIVSLFQWFCGDFYVSAHAYRLLANSLLYVVLYGYARIYVNTLCAFGVMLSIAMLYPITILRYNGQFTDPASHLSFALCLYCLASRREAGFQASFFTGILAKESILVMAICRALFPKRCIRALLLAICYLVLGVALTYAVHRYVNRGPVPFEFQSLSGTKVNQFQGNLANYRVWWGMYFVTLGALMPGAIAGWRLVDQAHRAICIIILVATLGTNLFVSLMWEVRNIVPAFIPLAILNFKYIEQLLNQMQPKTARP